MLRLRLIPSNNDKINEVRFAPWYNNYPNAKRRVLVGDTELQFVGFICGVCRHDSRAELLITLGLFMISGSSFHIFLCSS